MSQSEKIRLEHQAARLFMRIYEREFGVTMRHIWHNEPRKPDVTCYFDHQKLDLEIAHLYGSEAEAKHYLGRELSESTRHVLDHLQNIAPDHRLLDSLNTLLASKAEKYYESDQAWLVIRNLNPAWTRDDFIDKQHLIQMPDSHPFSQIWLLGDKEGRSGMVRLYPDMGSLSGDKKTD